MASLTLTVGSVAATATVADAKALAILQQYAVALGAEGTNQQKANAVLASLVQHIVRTARRARTEAAEYEGRAAVQADIDALDWA